MTIPFASCSLLAAASGADPRINENEWGAFIHLPNDQFYGLNMIRSEVVRDTEAKTGRNAGIITTAHQLSHRLAQRPHAHNCRLARINEGSRW